MFQVVLVVFGEQHAPHFAGLAAPHRRSHFVNHLLVSWSAWLSGVDCVAVGKYRVNHNRSNDSNDCERAKCLMIVASDTSNCFLAINTRIGQTQIRPDVPDLLQTVEVVHLAKGTLDERSQSRGNIQRKPNGLLVAGYNFDIAVAEPKAMLNPPKSPPEADLGRFVVVPILDRAEIVATLVPTSFFDDWPAAIGPEPPLSYHEPQHLFTDARRKVEPAIIDCTKLASKLSALRATVTTRPQSKHNTHPAQ